MELSNGKLHSPTFANVNFANMLLFHSLTLQRHWGLMREIASLAFFFFSPFWITYIYFIFRGDSSPILLQQGLGL